MIGNSKTWVAVAQAAPVLFHRQATEENACRLKVSIIGNRGQFLLVCLALNLKDKVG